MKIPAESAPESGTLARSPSPAARSALGSPPWPRSFPRRRGSVCRVRAERPGYCAERGPSSASPVNRVASGEDAARAAGRVRSRDWAKALPGPEGVDERLGKKRLPRAGARAGPCLPGDAVTDRTEAATPGPSAAWPAGSGRVANRRPARRGRGGRDGEARA